MDEVTNRELFTKSATIELELNKIGLGIQALKGQLEIVSITLQFHVDGLKTYKEDTDKDINEIRLNLKDTQREVQRLKDSRTWLLGLSAGLGFAASAAVNFFKILQPH